MSLYLQYIASTLQVTSVETHWKSMGNSSIFTRKKIRHRLVSLSSLAAPEFSQGHRLKLLEEWNCEALNDSLNGKWTWTWTEYEVGNWIIEYEMDFHECLWFAWWILMINDVVFEKKWIWNKILKKNYDDVGTEWNMLELNGIWWSWMEHNGNMMERNGLL